MSEIKMMTYNEVLKAIESKENHLLIGNGFNYGLGVNTGYSAIFDKMSEENSIYKDVVTIFNECNKDLELFIGRLEEDIASDNPFLKKYVRNKVKFDFMQATHQIVKSNIKNVYAVKNEGIYMLLRNFTNYFTLNYDSFLYLLLLKYKPIEDDKRNVIVLQPTLKLFAEEEDVRHNNIYTEIQNARRDGKLQIQINDVSTEKDLGKLPKTHFKTEIKAYSKSNKKGWKDKEINNVIDKIITEENRKFTIDNVDDGSRILNLFSGMSDYVYKDVHTQNLFFIHGAFHIYKEGTVNKKITQSSDKSLYDKLEDVLNSEEKDIVCVFQCENKMDVIKENEYLKTCLNKLSTLSGNMIIIGSSLAENDKHIFDKINYSQIDTLYISTLDNNKENTLIEAKKMFPNKEIHLFDADTISYDAPSEINK